MTLPDDSVPLKLFVGESDHSCGKPLHEQMVPKARELNLAGAPATPEKVRVMNYCHDWAR
jgi:PII-like signaling protein